jgi:hypothetical protein
MVKMMLPRLRFTRRGRAGNSAPNAKASSGGQRPSASGAGFAALVRRIRRRQAGWNRAARQAINRLDGGGYGFGIRLGPPKTPRQPLKEIFNLRARHGLIFTSILILRLIFVRIGFGNIRIVFAHANLIVRFDTNDAIVGEFAG